MLKTLVVFFTLVIGSMMAFHHSLQNGSFLKYLDEHPSPSWVPSAAYYVGEGYYLFQNLAEATTYFLRVAQRYPDSPLADDAYFQYLQCLDDQSAVPRAALAEGYEGYLERYPNGKHAEIVKNRLSAIQSGR